jgi:hypothetical protein
MINLGFAENLGQLTSGLALNKILDEDDLGARNYIHLNMAGL